MEVAVFRSTSSLLSTDSQFSMVDISAQQRVGQGTVSASDSSGEMEPSQNLEPGHILHIDMPISQMDTLKIGGLVKGHVRLPMLATDDEHVGEEFNTVPFTGQVCFSHCLTPPFILVQ
jgi:hypothetical protein